MRFVHQGPQYDINNTMSNFFPDKWQASQAPVLYVAGCSNGATVCSGNARNAMDPRHRPDCHRGRRGEHAGADRDSHSGHRHCAERDHSGGSGNREHRLHVANAGGRTSVRHGVRRDRERQLGDSAAASACSTTGRTATRCSRFRAIRRPRRTQRPVQRYAGDARPGRAEPAAGTGAGHLPVQCEGSHRPLQWNVGVQKSLPGNIIADVSYVGNHGYNRFGALQGGDTQNWNRFPSARRICRSIRIRPSARRHIRGRRLTRRTCSVRSSVSAHNRTEYV